MPVNELRVVREQVEAALRQVTAQLLRSDNQDGCERQSGWMTLGATGGRGVARL